MGPNYVLDKGFVLSNSGAAQAIYRCMTLDTETEVSQAAATGEKILGVCQERVDAADSATGNVIINVRILGITKVEAGANNIALGADVMTDTSGRAIPVAVGASRRAIGIALQASAAVGEWIDVLLVPAPAAIAAS